MVDESGKFTLVDFEQSVEGCTDAKCTEGVYLGIQEGILSDDLS